MRRGGRIFIILGLLLALIAGAGVFYVLASAEPAPPETPKVPLDCSGPADSGAKRGFGRPNPVD